MLRSAAHSLPAALRRTEFFLSVASIAALVMLAGRWTMPAAAVSRAAAAPKAYVGLFKDNAIAVVDTGSDALIKTIPIPAGPHGLAITPDGARVFASSDGDSKVSVIDTTSDTVVDTIEVGAMPHGLALTPDGRTLLVAVFGAGQVVFIDTSSDAITGRLAVGSPHNIAVTPDGSTAFVASQQQGNTALVVLDVASRTRTGTVPLDKTPRALNVRPDGGQLYFTIAGDDAVEVLDPTTLQIVGRIPVGASPHHPLYTPSGEYALVVSQGTNELNQIDPETNMLTATTTVGKNPHWIATDRDGETAFVTNEDSGDVSVVDVATMTVEATIPVGNGPRKIVVQPFPLTRQAAGAAAAAGGPMHGETTRMESGSAAVGRSDESGGADVAISGFSFSPQTLTVAAGQSVTFANDDGVAHTSTSDDSNWDSNPIAPGASFTVVFDQPGIYTYHCAIHPFMQGTIVVGG